MGFTGWLHSAVEVSTERPVKNQLSRVDDADSQVAGRLFGGCIS